MRTEESLKVVKKFCENFLKGNRSAMLADVAENVEWVYPGEPDIYYAGIYNGKAGVQEFFKKLYSSIEIQDFSLREFIAQDNKVAVTGYMRGYSISTEQDFETDWVMVFELFDNKIIRCQTFLDTAKVATAFWVA
jgi:hypothetical protein